VTHSSSIASHEKRWLLFSIWLTKGSMYGLEIVEVIITVENISIWILIHSNFGISVSMKLANMIYQLLLNILRMLLA